MLTIQSVAVIVIGRNEGQRLLACFQSLLAQTSRIIYVDSGSTDQSVAAAESLGITVVALDMSIPFTAARARNTGFERLQQLYPDCGLVQFIDGDCLVSANWLPQAIDFLNTNDQVAVVCGRRKEIAPEQSIYNWLCDIEWDTPIGQTKACGGDALMRVPAFKAVGGFNSALIAGEEPELCVRLRQAGWLIWRIDAQMTQHDAAMYRFSQWWQRAKRAGYAFAQGADLHGQAPELHWVAERNRARIWAGIIPACILIAFFIQPWLAVVLILLYPLQIVRLSLNYAPPYQKALRRAFFLVIGKFAELHGQLTFLWRKYIRQSIALIEYK